MGAGDWNGARWWRVDFHSHTPASFKDYGKGPDQENLKKRSPEQWLLDYMKAGIDCVAITDHNTGAWIGRLRQAFDRLESERPTGFRPIHLFPGVEISVQGGVHVLAILPMEKTESDVDRLLGAAGYEGSKGKSDDVTTKTFVDVASEIQKIGGIAIPAHADADNGLFRLRGKTLEQAIKCNAVYAVETVDPESKRPPSFQNVRWTEILGSDSHHPTGARGQNYPGSHFTWVKMGKPSIEGLRLALLDGHLSIRRSDQETRDPNHHAAAILRGIEVSNARYMGRKHPFRLDFNPWLNAVVGGRGTGKSTLVEFLRLVLRRQDELPDGLRAEFEKYSKAYPNRDDDGLLTEATNIRATYIKDEIEFRLQWDPEGRTSAIQAKSDCGWVDAEGEIPMRFPVRIYSQKQIFQLAGRPLALLRVIDDAPEVGRRSWDQRWAQERSRFLSLRAKARELESELSAQPRLRGELDDVKRKLAIFEKAGHAEILREFQKRSRQERAVESWQHQLDVSDNIRRLADDLVPDPFQEPSLDPETDVDASLKRIVSEARNQLGVVSQSLRQAAKRANAIYVDWLASRSDSPWQDAVDKATQAYDKLRDRLAEEGAGDPSAYGELVQRRQTIEQRLKDLQDLEKQLGRLREQATESLGRLLEMRRQLTKARREFLRSVLNDNHHVRIDVVPYGAQETVEAEFRRLVQKEGGEFEKDIGSPFSRGLLGRLYAGPSKGPQGLDRIERNLAGLKKRILEIAASSENIAGIADLRFKRHIEKLPPEALDRIECWFPEDSLDVQYSATGKGRDFRSIKEASPGQKTAALLAFLFSYGNEPLILDQPEDDLDNQLIYELVVTQLRQAKLRRQVIVVTHNANIVVNGDAELVAAFAAKGGETQKECEGSLQEEAVRSMICEIMEGGRVAFQQRYHRILEI